MTWVIVEEGGRGCDINCSCVEGLGCEYGICGGGVSGWTGGGNVAGNTTGYSVVGAGAVMEVVVALVIVL